MNRSGIARTLAVLLLVPSLSIPAHAQWQVEVVDSVGDVGSDCSLAIDQHGLLHVSYRERGVDDLKYAVQQGPGWQIELVHQWGDVGYFSSIALDSSGAPRIAHFDHGNRDLLFACKNGASWDTTSGVDNVGDVGWHCSLYKAEGGWDEVIAYINDDTDTLKLARRAAPGWQIEPVESGLGFDAGYTSVSDFLGYASISYRDGAQGALKYAWQKSTGGWGFETVDSVGDVGQYTSLVYDRVGWAYIAYHDLTTESLKVAHDTTGGWQIETVQTGGGGRYASLAVDAAGFPHVAYWDVGTWDLKYAYRHRSGGWSVETVDSQGDVGHYSSLVLDGEGRARIAYYDLSNGDLKVAFRTEPTLDFWVSLEMPSTYFHPGDGCQLVARAYNQTGTPRHAPLFVVLDVQGGYWFWPSWGQSPAHLRVTVHPPYIDRTIIPSFLWPNTGGDSMNGLVFWGALTDDAVTQVLGGADGLGSFTFGYGP